jgi:phytoene dehydrogenase-like protein
MATAIVVGAGPNGLAAAVTLAQRGVDVTVLEAADDIGGGTRSGEAILPGLLHDHCSAIHPLAAASPFLRGLGLDRYGLRWGFPEIDCVHPLDDGRAGVLYRSIAATAAGLGADGARWRALFGGVAAQDLLGPVFRVPRHPVRLARAGVPAVASASLLGRAFRTEEARALFGGIAAHAFAPLERPLTAAIGVALIGAGHQYGWPVALGGSRSISGALARLLGERGGRVETGVLVRSSADVPPADVTLYDLTPTAVAGILGDRLPGRVARAYRRYRYGPGAFKVDFAVEDGVPWKAAEARRAGTVHVGGSFRQIAAASREINAGRLPERPFVLVGQQYLVDPARSVGNVHPVWTYAQVPNGFDGDATELVVGQIERFAPGFRDRIVGRVVGLGTDNPNYVGGNIGMGERGVRQTVFGERVTLWPYDVGVPGHYLCSAATPPGPGVHGMCGHHAAVRALRRLRLR